MKQLRVLLSIIFIASTLTSYSQRDSVNVKIHVTNKVDNDSWFENLATLDKDQQLDKIKQRLLADTIALTIDSAWTVKSLQPLTVEFFCRPLIRINQDTIIIETIKQTKELISILNDTRFNKIEILHPDIAKRKYKKWGLCGILILETKDKSIRDKLKEIGV